MTGILIADDNERVLASVRSMLASQGWQVVGEAQDGAQAVALAGRLAPDLAVLDFAMPVLDGINAAREILKTSPGLPIVLYTLHQDPQLEEEAVRAGIRAVVSKMSGRERLFDAVREGLSAALLAGQPFGGASTSAASGRQPAGICRSS